jgi:hydroxymethylpyrimidine kinase/phosphomethylpyrimidine kinase
MIIRHRLQNVVVDPVMIAKGGRRVMQENAQRTLVRKLLPLARVVTPNIPEAEALTGMKIRSVAAMKDAAARIARLGAKNVVVKGGHLVQSRRDGSVDVLYDGRRCREFGADWIDTPHTHGTGCTFAAALAAGLAQGKSVAAPWRRRRK